MSNVKNSVQLIGHMGIDPEIKTLEGGTKVARLRMATTEKYKNKNGEWLNDTTWHNIVAWEGLAERAEKLLQKGTFLLLEGKLVSRNYTDAAGVKKYIYEVRATNFIVLDKKEPTSPLAETNSSKDDLPF